MIFVIRQIQEKCIEQHRSLFMVFIDLAKAFDTISRALLWDMLRRFGCPPKFMAVVEALHDGAMVRVLGEGQMSDPFEVSTGVRQGCVIAPVIFNLFLAGVMMAAKHGINPEDGVPVTYRLDGSLFNLRRLKAPTKVTRDCLVELQYADDVAIVSCSADGMQHNLRELEQAYTRAGLVINTDKTEAMSVRQPDDEPATFRLNGTPLKDVAHFRYLGSTINDRGNIDEEVQRRIGLASASFGQFTKRVFLSRNLTVRTKVAVYRAICLSILLYASETWVTYSKHTKRLERFHINCLQQILGLKWWHRVPHTEIRRRAGVDSLEAMIVQRRLRWVGHVIRMPENRLPRQMMYGQLTEGQRSVGGQRKRYKNCVNTSLKACGIPPNQLETLAESRDVWRDACTEGMNSFSEDYDRRADERRARRHRPPADGGQHPCDVCGRICASRIGLISHRRTHQR